MSTKIKDKQGIMFPGCPVFKDLREDDREVGRKKDRSSVLSKSEFDKEVEKHDERNKTILQRRKSSKRDPSVKEIREHLRKIIKYHCKIVNETIPSVYPILGPVNLDSDDEEEGFSKRGGEKMSNTKGELKRYNEG